MACCCFQLSPAATPRSIDLPFDWIGFGPACRPELSWLTYKGYFDIVADRFDAGVRLGESIDKDMIAMPSNPKLRMAAVASPDYFKNHPVPKAPEDLTNHRCINIRFPPKGGLYVWEFERRGRQVSVRVDGQVTFNTSPHMVLAALDGLGVAFLPEEEFSPHIETGRLVRVLENWCPPFPGYHLYYPSRRQTSPAFSLVLDALRIRVASQSCGSQLAHSRRRPLLDLGFN
ncbi:MAG: LysR substrate-binding domain-containing protein [Pseudoxanthomonas sp.]